MQRYFLETVYQAGEDIQVTGDAFHHMIHVMRMSQGDECYLVFQDELVITARLVDISEKTAIFQAVCQETRGTELPVLVTIACGFPKGDKLDLIVQKAVELGAYEIKAFPSVCSVVKWDQKKLQKKQDRLQKIAQEAAEQSHRSRVPKVTLYASEADFLRVFQTFDHILIAYEEAAKLGERGQLAQTLQQIAPKEKLLAVFGPEGGFTPKEINHFKENGAKICGLGPRILRAETAPLYFLSSVSYAVELQ